MTPSAAAATAERRGAYLLTLEGHAGETIAFSDRPQRTFGEVKTLQFLDTMEFTSVNPPNAALVVDTPQGEDDVLLVELLHPSYDAQAQTLTYEADVLQEYRGEGLQPLAAKQGDGSIAREFNCASLFIDDCPDANPLYCYTDCDTAVGNLGNRGKCWGWNCFCCAPCAGGWAGTARECNERFPACNGRCFTAWSNNCILVP